MPAPTQADLDYLKSNPDAADKFRAHFGPRQVDLDYLSQNPDSRSKFEARFGPADLYVKPEWSEPQTTGGWLADKAKFVGGRLANAALSVPGLPADIIGLELRGLDYLTGSKTPTANPLEFASGATIRGAAHDYGSQALNAFGANTAPEDLQPRDPRNTAERYLGNVADFVGYGAGPGALTKNALSTAAGGATGLTVAQEVAPDSTLAQIGGAIAGMRAPGAIASRGAAAFPGTRAALRGPNPSSITDEMQAYDRLTKQTGVSADVMPGQLQGEYSGQQIVDAMIARSPGGQPGVLRANESQAKLFDESINQRSSNPTGQKDVGLPSPTNTGNRILEDFDKSTKRFRDRQEKIENFFESRVGAQTQVGTSNTQRAIDTLKRLAKTDPEIEKLIADPYVRSVDEALKESGGRLTYSAARALKTDAGELIPKAGRLGNVKAGQIKKLYGALSEDIGATMNASGLGSAWERYNKWATDTYDRAEKIFDKITKGKELAPEKVSDSFVKLDASSMRAAMKNMTPDGRAMAAGQILFEAAKTKAAGAAAEDVATSYQKFLGNILELKKRGKFDAAFGEPQFKPLRDTVDDLLTITKPALRANKVAHDVSGATALRGAGMYAIGTHILTGSIEAAAGVFALTFVAPAVAGKILRSKAYLNWLAYARKAQPGESRRVLQRLEMIAVRDQDPKTRAALQQFVPAFKKVSEGAAR